MYDINTITQGTDFTLRVRAKRLGYNNFVKVSFQEISNIQVNLVSLPNQKTPLSYSYDETGRLVIPVDGQSLDCNTYGLEVTGFYNNGNWRQMIAPVVEIVHFSGNENYPEVQSENITIDLDVTLGETYVSSRSFAKTIGEMETTISQRDQDLESTKGRVSSLESAVETLPASIPTKTSQLTNDSSFQTEQQVSTTVQEAITASRINDAEANLIEDGGEPELIAGISGQKIILLGKNLKGAKGDKGDPLTWDDLTDPQKASLKGAPGDNAILLEGESPLAQVVSNATDKAITPKAVSDAILPISGIDDRWSWRTGKRMHPGTASTLQNDSAFQTSYPLQVNAGDVVEITTAGDNSHPFTCIAYLATESATTWVKKAAQEVATSAVNTYKWTATTDGYVVVCGVISGMVARVVKANRLAKFSELKDLEEVVKNNTISDLTLTAISGSYYNSNGTVESNSNYNRTGFVDLSEYEGCKVRITLPSDYASDSSCHVLKDSNGRVVKYISSSSIVSIAGKVYEMPVIKEGYSIGFSWRNGKTITAKIVKADVRDVVGDIEKVDALTAEVGVIANKIEAVTEINIPVTQGSVINYTKAVSIASGVEYTLECLPTGYVDSSGFNLKINYTDDTQSGTINFKPGDKLSRKEAKAVKSFNFQRSAGGAIGSGNVEVVITLMSSINGRLEKLEKVGSDNTVMYVSTTGNDTNSGKSLSSAKATINSALDNGAEIIMIDGGTYFMDINLAKAKRGRVSIKGVSGKRVVIKGTNSTICDDGSEELVDGYANVYKVPVSYPHMPYRWLYFDGLNDEDTLIQASERHPSQKGKYYRCESTRIVPCSSQTLADALEEIEAATKYKWFFDSGYLYFNRHSSTDIYPLMDSGTGSPHIKGNSTVFTPIDLEISNIEFMYEEFSVANLNSVHLSSVSSKYVRGNGAILYDRTLNAVFENCEAARACTGSYGDGFNAHAADSEAGSRGTYAQLINCWSHDNMDDGYSDHEYSEVLVIGGLYEYNGKAGITPSYGSHLNGHNILSRRNYCGYYYIGAKQDGGNGGQMALYNCISDSNNRGGQNAGYYIDYGNDAILYNCIAINETTGFKCSSSQMKLIDCKVVDCVTAKEGQTITVVNGTPL